MGVRTRRYRNGVLEAENFPMAEISDWIVEPDVTIWLDLHDPTDENLAALGEELGLHRLAVEDAGHERQRPKLDHYRTHLFLNVYDIELREQCTVVASTEIAAFITPQALVTVHRGQSFDISAVIRRWDEAPDLAKYGVSFLLYGLLDYVVDSYFTAVQALDEEVDTLEEVLFDESPQRGIDVQRRTFALRKSLVTAKWVILPMREVVNALMRRDYGVVGPEMAPYYQDVYDHVLRASEWTDNMRDLVTTILETHLTIQGNRLNMIMKKVTSWAAIIAVPTAVTGFYGQNVPYPGFAKEAGLWWSVGIMIALSVTLYVSFKRRDWL